MAKKTAQQITDKYQRGVAGAAPDYAAGVANPSRPWAQATAAGASRWQAGLQKAISEGRFQKGVQAAGDDKWARRAATIGAQRYSESAPAAAAEFARMADSVVAAGETASRAAESMPDTTIDQRIQRAAAAMKATSAYWAGRKR